VGIGCTRKSNKIYLRLLDYSYTASLELERFTTGNYSDLSVGWAEKVGRLGPSFVQKLDKLTNFIAVIVPRHQI
jgi:hypothetical protein